MKIGIMSDTHDRLEAVEQAIDLFNREEVAQVLHAGDLVSPFVAPRFARLKAKLHYVWGNNEGDQDFITKKFGEIGINPLGDFAALELGGLRIALLHGKDERVVEALSRSGLFDVVVRGHTHRAGISKEGALVINPGEVCGYLTGQKTVALLETKEMRAEILPLQL
jgi:hypothetical protein